MLLSCLPLYFWKVPEWHLEQQYCIEQDTLIYCQDQDTHWIAQWRTKTLRVRRTHVLCLWIPQRDKLSLGYTSNITKKEDEYSYSLMSYFDIKRSFLICSRDKGDRHTPILIEDENLFTAFDDLPLDDTWNKRDPEPYQDINVLLFLGFRITSLNQPTRPGH